MTHSHETVPMTAGTFATMIDHTLLKPESTPADVAALAREAETLGTYSICVSPSMLPIKTSVHVATVCGFPSGQHSLEMKAAEASDSVARGAEEIDMVINVGRALAGDQDYTYEEIAAVRAAAPAPTVLKVIIESAALTEEAIIASCTAAQRAGADFVKTSTGFHPAGGATTHAVALMRATVGPDMGVKASGGIRTLAAARSMIQAGANRLGLSGSAAILAEISGSGNNDGSVDSAY